MKTTQQGRQSMPTIVVSTENHKRLTGLAAVAEAHAPEVASVLSGEMERARVVRPETLPADAVQMGSTVEFRTETGKLRRVTLVYPGDADIAQGRVCILTPIGAALVGLSPGQSMSWIARDGREHLLTVLKVEPPAPAVSELASVYV